MLTGVDKKLTKKQERTRQRKLKEKKKIHERMCYGSLSSSLTTDFTQTQGHDDQPISSDESLEEPLPSTSHKVSSEPTTRKNRARKDFITPKLIAVLDRCQLSIRDSVYIIQAVVEALDLSCDDFPINISSIQRIRTQSRKDRVESIKSDFQNNMLETVHWDAKLLPDLDVKSSKEERPLILISFGENEQLLTVRKRESSSGQDQAKAVLNALYDWNLDDKVQIMGCDTTVSNTGRLKGAFKPQQTRPDIANISLSLRIPPFYHDRPRLWFYSFEAATNDSKKGDHQKAQLVIAQLEKEVIEQITDFLYNPPPNEQYKATKERLISAYEESDSRQFQRLLSETKLSDQKPTQLLRRMQDLARDRIPDAALRLMWTNHLPPHIRSVLAVSQLFSDKTTLEELALTK
ncbi:hypothetical protein EVAR_23445_1 [Eumeta japonica]|uniref:DUF7041 domain-containing protein n=1 Tax=Eumeta variegata TaxID=151549 RepID=A0A4C1UJS4_EUMVA|nr:hypothetical protein EVAR_23445_1 [Eumeta japonica]